MFKHRLITHGLLVAATAFGLTGCASCEQPADGPGPGPEPECRVASVNCACDTTGGEGGLGRCDDGLACTDGICRGVTTTGLKISDPAARSCELLLTESGGRFADAVFSGAVTGRVIREGHRAAIAFHANSNAAIDGDAVKIAFTGQVEQIDQALTLSSARCFDGTGKAIAGAGLSF